MFETTTGLSCRAVAVLRATRCGRVQVSLSSEPDFLVDGLAFCDQPSARALVHAGLVRPARPGRIGDFVPATLTETGHVVLADADPSLRGSVA